MSSLCPLVKDSRWLKTPCLLDHTVLWCSVKVFLCTFVFFPPSHQGEEELDMSSTELLYQGILPSLPQYMVSTTDKVIIIHIFMLLMA